MTELDRIRHFRHQHTRKNNPPATIAGEGRLPDVKQSAYTYSPRQPPLLRFDPVGEADEYLQLLKEAKRRPLTDEEARTLAAALSHQEPWLEWAYKAEEEERRVFQIDPVALHIHERISAEAVLRAAKREDIQRDLFADPDMEYREAVKFYEHDMEWANRLILGDSMQVMASLAAREDLAGKVQMIYVDPPYGIKFSSNFQPEIGRRDVREKDEHLTREPEQVRAYRDTWKLGVHSYLSYLRQRLVVARELLRESGSIFVQIGDENVHRVRCVLDAC